MFKGIIFDLDGTLLNTIDDIADCCNSALIKNGFPPYSVEEYKHMVGNGVRKLIERAIPIEADAGTVDKVHYDFNELYKKNFLVKTAPYHGIDEMIRDLKDMGIKLGVLSNKPHMFTSEMVELMFPDRPFDVVSGQRDSIPPKPAPDGPLMELEVMGLTADESLYAGDSDVDIMTAKSSGMHSVGCTWGFRGERELRESGAEFIVNSPSEITEIVRRSLDR